jgi:hypothetical protein
MTYEPVSDYNVDLSVLYETWLQNRTMLREKYRAYEHWTLDQYGFCIEHTPKGPFFEIHDRKKFLLLLMAAQ